MLGESILSYWDKSVLNITPCDFGAEERLEVEVHFPFVGLLPPAQRAKFYRRLCKLMRSIDLHERGVVLTKADRMMIATPAIILSFGFKWFHWGNFKRVFVYPRAYKNKQTGNYHHGETSPMGVVVLNWSRVQHGIEDPDDALHLLYHEYAHALYLSKRNTNHNEDARFNRLYEERMKDFMREMKRTDSTIMREYAFTNPHEFFACAVEVLMERADELKREHPNLYATLIKMLKLKKWESLLLTQATWYR